MEISSIKSLVAQPNVCRLCLATTGTWDLTSSADGTQEVLTDTLQECYGITLSCPDTSSVACGKCVEHLRDAAAFRNQVLEAEKHWQLYWKEVSNWPVKIEDEPQKDFEVSHTFQDYIQPDIQDDISNPDKDVTSKRLRTRQRRNVNVQAKRKRKKISKNERASDTPIAQLSSQFVPSSSENKSYNVDDTTNEYIEDSCSGLQKVYVCIEDQHNTHIKKVSERKRLILTCAIVLKDTTACPFRHHKSWFQCFFCHQDFMEINLLRTHTSQIHPNTDEELRSVKRYPRSLQIDITDLKCRHCDIPLTDVDAMTRHFENVHQKTVYKECIADYKVDASPYTCHICKREFHVFRTLTTHLNEHYANCICDVCGKSFLNSKRLKVHKRTHENGTFPCSECGKVLKTKTSKANHMESAHSKRIMKCQICFEPMKHYNDRIKHMSEVHNITHNFACSICGRVYNIKHYLATHMRQTHGHKNKKCSECGMAFITNHGLKKHMMRHSGEKPFSCRVCAKSYVRNCTLKEHMRVHERETN